jgi:hypothetical protein
MYQYIALELHGASITILQLSTVQRLVDLSILQLLNGFLGLIKIHLRVLELLSALYCLQTWLLL